MKNGSSITDSTESQLAHIKKRYNNNFSDIEPEKFLQDISTLLKIIENLQIEQKDPRVTIELAKLRKENQSLKKELAKFFPTKDSVETTSKKLEHLFKIDTTSLIRYENSDLKEKNEKLSAENERILKKCEENSVKLQNELENTEKLKEISAELRVENTNLILKNRELQKKVKAYEEQNGITENLQKKLRSVLVEADKGKPMSKSEGVQTEEVKASKLMARLEHKKKDKSWEIDPQVYVFCAGKNKAVLNVAKVFMISVKNKGKKSGIKGIKLEIEKGKKMLCKPVYDKKIRNDVVEQGVRKPVRLEIEEEVSIGCRPLRNKNLKNAKKLRVLAGIYIEVLPKAKKFELFKENSIVINSLPKEIKKLTLQRNSSIVVKAKVRSKESLLMPFRNKLSISKTISASLQGRPKRKLMISIPSTASLLPPKLKKGKNFKVSLEFHQSILPIPEHLSLYVKSVFNTKESEEFEVFNAATLYRPQLSPTKPSTSSFIPTKKSLSTETSSLSCRKRVQKLKLSHFQIFNQKSEKISIQKFSVFHKKTVLEVQILRRLGYVPENKATDDEESKSSSGATGRRKPRTPARKPAIEEYFNLVKYI